MINVRIILKKEAVSCNKQLALKYILLFTFVFCIIITTACVLTRGWAETRSCHKT